ncbi:Pectate lyase H [Colletotrichum fructicola]|nr:Pectate lyase H [Colletotrichum fructicola]
MSESIETNPGEDMVFITSPPAEGIDPDASREFLDLFRTENGRDIPLASYYIDNLSHDFNFEDLMRWVTDPDTGDTAMHVAAAVGNIKAFDATAQSFGREWSRNSWFMTCFRAVFFLRNKAGDTIFHVAARMGRLDIINAAWQHFWQVIDWDKVPDKPGSEVYAPIDHDLPEFETDVDPLWVPDYMLATVLLARKNAAGHTAADEATIADYTDVAAWLNQVLDRVTLGGKRATESRMARIEELVDGRYDIDGHHLTWDQIPRAGVIDRRQTGDGPGGSADSTQGDLGERPPPRFPFPVTKFPVAKETVVLEQTMYILPGQVFDGEGTDADAVFNLLPGSTIRNVIIGKHQAEGIHALGDAWVENDNSLGGKYNITGFYAENFGTFYQSCGNCLNQAKRNATIQNVVAVNGIRMGIINPNYGDEFRLKNAQLQDLEVIVDKEIANNVQTVPYTIGNGPDLKYALYNETRDAITDYDGEVLNAYEPEEPYEWLEDFWPEGFN